ncbi:hypothetical protein J6590_055787 [Homalodisca vitripennis]|nr:hypothetical protein J6590_055787 [Homalodisca vitripennis]
MAFTAVVYELFHPTYTTSQYSPPPPLTYPPYVIRLLVITTHHQLLMEVGCLFNHDSIQGPV